MFSIPCNNITQGMEFLFLFLTPLSASNGIRTRVFDLASRCTDRLYYTCIYYPTLNHHSHKPAIKTPTQNKVSNTAQTGINIEQISFSYGRFKVNRKTTHHRYWPEAPASRHLTGSRYHLFSTPHCRDGIRTRVTSLMRAGWYLLQSTLQ